ncbi:MFS transporter [Oenococcus sicerae]|uniref:MFS transporter n=1 Tax=Oenococcus sicerae TaxID=2203724 RepID=UPI0010B9F965|nr:Riboflavin transporter RibZ {ECO:0000305} [Oenococcus sicerae]
MQTNKKWWIFTAIVIFSFMSTLTSSIVNIALPVISKAMHISTIQSNWIVSIYLIITCMLLLPFGSLSDLYGKVKIFKYGALIFTIGSLLCGFNLGFNFLLVARIIQAIGASMTLSTNAAIITETFSEAERGFSLGIFSAIVALGATVGPGLGGLILTYLPWNYIFWVNVPLGIITIILGQVVLPKKQNTAYISIDFSGLIILALTIGSLFTSLILGQRFGFQKLQFVTPLIISFVLAAALIVMEKHTQNPAINFSLFRDMTFSINLVSTILVYGLNFLVNIIGPLYLEENRGLSTKTTGLILMSFPIIQIIISPIAGRLSDRFGAWKTCFSGLFLLLLSQVVLASVGHTTPIWILCVWLGLVGLGNGIFQAPNNVMIMGSVSEKKLGIVSGLLGLARNTGMTLGTIFSSILLFQGISQVLGYSVNNYPQGHAAAFISGMHFTFLIMTLVFLCLSIISIWIQLRNKEQRRSY